MSSEVSSSLAACGGRVHRQQRSVLAMALALAATVPVKLCGVKTFFIFRPGRRSNDRMANEVVKTGEIF